MQQLSQQDAECWETIRESNPALASPFFSAEFTRAVAAVRNDAFVAILHSEEGVAGYFPFQRGPHRIGNPIGGILSDYQGAIVRPDLQWNAAELVQACGLAAWDYDHLIASQSQFAPLFHRHYTHSLAIDLTMGYQDYVEQRCAAGSKLIADLNYEERHLTRRHGALSFAAHTKDASLLDLLLGWKQAQYRRTGVRDIFALDWVTTVIRNIHDRQTEDFGGILSCLFVGDRPVAAHFGMRSSRVWQAWFPAYDPEFAEFSPGLLLYIKMAQCAESLGLTCIDLGKGDQPYKLRLVNSRIPICEGSVERSSSLKIFRRFSTAVGNAVRRSPLRSTARFVKRQARRGRSWFNRSRVPR